MKNFDELNLIEPLRRALRDEQYATPTEIQSQAIPQILNGRDVLGCAQTGTGKTAAFALPILNHLAGRNERAVPNDPRVLVLAPTRELAIQIDQSFKTYGRHLRLQCGLAYGGVNQGNQVRVLKRGTHILVATPGRLLDLMNQGHVHLDRLEIFVLDEADRMLDMGFLPDLRRIIKALPERRQSLFFSATLPPNIVQLSRELLRDPVHVQVVPTLTNLERIEQKVLFVPQNRKTALLERILRDDGMGRTLVFTKTKRGANRVSDVLNDRGIRCTAIHGNKSQAARQRALEEFRRDHVQVLVATDVVARGIDVDGITHVVNFELPIEPENYVHRIGRTARAGASGEALSFCCPEERPMLRDIERLIGHKIPVDGGHAAPDSAADETPRPTPRRKSVPPHGRNRRPAPAAKGSNSQPRRRRRPTPRHPQPVGAGKN